MCRFLAIAQLILTLEMDAIFSNIISWRYDGNGALTPVETKP
jgi:hypothetical protein